MSNKRSKTMEPVLQRILKLNSRITGHKRARTNCRVAAIEESTDRYDSDIAYHTEQIRLLKETKTHLSIDCNSNGRCCGQHCRCGDCVECGGQWYDDGKFG